MALLIRLGLAAVFLSCAVEVRFFCFIAFGLNFDHTRMIEIVESNGKIQCTVNEHGKASTHCRVKKLVLLRVGRRDEIWSQTLGVAKEKKERFLFEHANTVE
ncbi:hypothetical protein BT93_B0883 [Corymbia citriodora subsp. variegata]|nr:hypothetical protein BT93_B0883 [Corymbia citriodora subsp. variegata]